MFLAAAALSARSNTKLTLALQELENTLDGVGPEAEEELSTTVALERASLTGMAEADDTPDWETVDGTEFSVLMNVGRSGKLVGPDVAQGKAVCDKEAGRCKKISAGGSGQVYFGQARVRVHEKTSMLSDAITDTDFTGSVVIKQSFACMMGPPEMGKPSDVTKEQEILRHLQKNRHEEGGANLMSVYGFYTMEPSGSAKDKWKCDIIAEKVPYQITWETAWHPKAVGQLVRQALLGLSFMHRHHTAHLDLKPENMMSHTDPLNWFDKAGTKLAAGTIKLIDTGGGEEDRKSVHWFGSEFKRVTEVGSPLYFAPEVAKNAGQEIKPYKADIWSMGMVAVALLCGEGDYDHKKMKELSKHIDSQNAVADYIHAIFPFTSSDDWGTAKYKDAREFVNAALKYDPDERKTAAKLLEMDFVAA